VKLGIGNPLIWTRTVLLLPHPSEIKHWKSFDIFSWGKKYGSNNAGRLQMILSYGGSS
jgi:hypothetical protein